MKIIFLLTLNLLQTFSKITLSTPGIRKGHRCVNNMYVIYIIKIEYFY